MINFQAIRVIYKYEMLRAWHTLLQTIASPVISTSLYFVVFGAAIGSRIEEVEGVSYGVFIVPGLVMLSLLTQSIANASFGIFFPKFTGTIRVEVVNPRHHHSDYRQPVRRSQYRASVRHGAVPGADLHILRPVRIHYRPVGDQLRETAADPDAGDYAAGVSRRQFLLGQHAAPGLADGNGSTRCCT
jgi:hypothetical protein